MATARATVHEELELVLGVLPDRVVNALREREDVAELLEVVLDLGRVPEARFLSGDVPLDGIEVDTGDLDQVIEKIGEFGDDNRAGIERTLHRISAIRNRKGRVIGVTCRVGTRRFRDHQNYGGPGVFRQEHPVARPAGRRQDYHASGDSPCAFRRGQKAGHNRRYVQRDCWRRRRAPPRHRAGPPDASAPAVFATQRD